MGPRRSVFLLLCPLLLGACASFPKSGGTYAGTYFYNFESAVLTPQGTHDRWCIKGDLSSAELPGGWGTAEVVVQGTVGPVGHYGNLGSCQRVITVTKLLEVRNQRSTQS
jgi:hypothetical protein